MKTSPNQTGSIFPLTPGRKCVDMAKMAQILDELTPTGQPVQFGPVTFEADRACILRPAPARYLEAELLWCHTKSERVADLERISAAMDGPKKLAVWNRHTDPDGNTIGNHGRTILRGGRFEAMMDTIKADLDTRRAIIIYPARDAIRKARDRDMNDLSCTVYCHLFATGDGYLNYHVNMRALDLGMGYPADFAWHWHLLQAHIMPQWPELKGRVLCTAGVATVYPHHRTALKSPYQGPAWDNTHSECQYGKDGEYADLWRDLCL